MHQTVAIILAAGQSRRMGSPKSGLVLPDGRTLLAAHCAAFADHCEQVVVVTGATQPALPAGVRAVHNPDWATTWPADSLKLALDALDHRGHAWVTPVDTPPAGAQTIERMINVGAPAVPVDRRGRRGHPVLLGVDEVMSVRARAPSGGLRALLAEAPTIEVADPDVASDFDTPECWQRFVSQLERRRSAG